MDRFLSARGKRLVGWDEILEGGLAPNAAVMSWRGMSGGVAAAKAGHDVVMSPRFHCYLDYYQGSPLWEPKAIPLMVLLPTAYAFDPVPKELSPAEEKHILGLQGNLWSEFFPNANHVEYMAWPRLCALAEIGWSAKESRDWDGFQNRLASHLSRFDAAEINYRPLDAGSLERRLRVIPGQPPLLVLRNPFPEGETRYSLDGSNPDRQSPLYNGPVPMTQERAFVRVRFYKSSRGLVSSVAGIQYLGKPWPCVVTTTLPQAYGEFVLERAFDGDERTFFWASAPPETGAHLTLSFLQPAALRKIEVLTGGVGRGERDLLLHGVVESSQDGRTFVTIAEFRDGKACGVLPDGFVASVRIRTTAQHQTWVAIREIRLQF